MQWVVQGFAWVMMRVMRTSGAESLSAAANIFVGQTEAPLLIRPYVAHADALGADGGDDRRLRHHRRRRAGGVRRHAVAALPDIAGHLIAASVMAAPAGLVMAKLMLPETEESLTAGTVQLEVERPWSNVIDAAAEGATDGLGLALNVAAMLIAFIALLALVNAALGWPAASSGFPQLTLEAHPRLGAAAAGLGDGRAVGGGRQVGALLGIKTGANEFVAYTEMGEMIDAGELSRALAA